MSRLIRTEQARAPWLQVGIGLALAALAVLVRSSLPLDAQQLPTITVVVGTAVATTFFGVRAGTTCAVAGGIGCWYLFFNPHSWSLGHGAWIPLVGFAIIATVILTTSHLYRQAERLAHEREMADVAADAETNRLFAGELAHRLKNTLTIIQALALRTLDRDAPSTVAFNERLRALATGHDLLSHDVSHPSAMLSDVVRALVTPFAEGDRAVFRIIDAPLSSSDVITLALALHELATNATKYGALSSPSGRIVITSEDRGDHLRLCWKEEGGPPVSAPQRTGFGSHLLSRAGAGTQVAFDPDGLRCSLSLAKLQRA